MKYPIDTNRYIESTRVLYGAKGEEVCRDYLIPAMNDAYRDGKAGAAGYPKDPAAEIAEYEAQRGPMSSDWGRRFTAAFIRCLNVSYAQGRRWPMGRKSQIKGRRAGACPYPSEPRVPGRGWPGAELWGGAGPIRPPRDTYRVQEGGDVEEASAFCERGRRRCGCLNGWNRPGGMLSGSGTACPPSSTAVPGRAGG